MDELVSLTASQLAGAIRARDVTSAQAVEALLDRIATRNPALNAIITIDAERARQRAKDADGALARGESWGPLHGVPITIKDSFETVGLRTVSGYPPLSENLPEADAPPVARLRAAGAIILGKTNLPTLASGIQCNNPVFGRTLNPWDTARTPGGSSGGSAAVVAARLSYLDLGSDIGGSIRIPAHFCGVYGLKSTGGRVSGKGHIASSRRLIVPTGWEALLQLASFGPLARSVEDLRLALQVISEPTAPPLGVPTTRPLSDLRIAWTDDFGGVPVTADTRRLVSGFAAALEKAQCVVEHKPDAGFDYDEAWYVAGACLGAINTLFQPPAARWIRRLSVAFLSILGPRDALMRGIFAGASLSQARIRDALRKRETIIGQLEGFLGTYDAWVVPVFPSPAFTHRPPTAPIEVDAGRMPQLSANLLHSVIFNLTGSPVVTMPIGQSSAGLPIGVQVVGRRWEEMALLDVAEAMDAVISGYSPLPDCAR